MTNVKTQLGVMVPMRDGVRLATDVFVPEVPAPVPAIVVRTPYDRTATALVNLRFDVLRAAARGYAVVTQDTRGRFASEGTFTPFADEAADGADTLAWVRAQPWCDGRVGMAGGSYLGVTQWAAAANGVEPPDVISPFATGSSAYDGWTYQGGAFQLGFTLYWTLTSLAMGEAVRRRSRGEDADIASLIRAVDGCDSVYRRLPLTNVPELADLAPYYAEWLAHRTYDDYWRSNGPVPDDSAVAVPSLNVGGWFDIFLKGTLENYRRSRERNPGGTRLLIGPWAHLVTGGLYPEASFGVASGTDGIDMNGIQLRWFDERLKGIEDDAAPVRLFVMGIDQWRDEDVWPLTRATPTRFHLRSTGQAALDVRDGRLTEEPPGAGEPEDVYAYDPRDPVPTLGGSTYMPGAAITSNAGPRDQRSVESRPDVLTYTSAPLETPVEVTGPVRAVLHVASSAVDTDITVKLVDVWPDGRAMSLADGIIRARYRGSLSDPSLLEPGTIYALEIDLVAVSNVFGAGHRIRVDVSSSNFPRFDRNPNTGEADVTELGATVVAVNRVFHSSQHPSHIVLPVIR